MADDRARFMASLGISDADVCPPPGHESDPAWLEGGPKPRPRSRGGHPTAAAVSSPPAPPPRAGRRAQAAGTNGYSAAPRRRKAEPINDAELRSAGVSIPNESSDMDTDECKRQANALMGAGDWAAALDWYTATLDRDPNSAALLSNRSSAWLQSDLPQGPRLALRDAERAEAMRGDWYKPLSRQGDALFHMGRFDEATAAYTKALEMDPHNESVQESLRRCRESQAEEAEKAGYEEDDFSAASAATSSVAKLLLQPDLGEGPSGRLASMLTDFQSERAAVGETCGAEYRRRELERFRESGTPRTPSNLSQATPDSTFSSGAAAAYRDGMLEQFRRKKHSTDDA